MGVLGLLRRSVNQARIRCRVLWLELFDRFKIGRVGHDFRKLLQLLQLIQFCFGLLLLNNSNAHDNSFFWLNSKGTPEQQIDNDKLKTFAQLGQHVSLRGGECRSIWLRQADADTPEGASLVRREPIAARTKLFPSSHIGPGNLRHSVNTSSSALTNMSTSFSPMMSGGRIFRTSIAWPATCVRIRCLLNN